MPLVTFGLGTPFSFGYGAAYLRSRWLWAAAAAYSTLWLLTLIALGMVNPDPNAPLSWTDATIMVNPPLLMFGGFTHALIIRARMKAHAQTAYDSELAHPPRMRGTDRPHINPGKPVGADPTPPPLTVMTLRPLPATRLANCVGAFGLALLVTITPLRLAEDTMISWGTAEISAMILLFTMVPTCLILVTRACRLAVICTRETVTIRGAFLTRRIPRANIVQIVEKERRWPSLRWQTPEGRKGSTSLALFASTTLPYIGLPVLPFVGAHNRKCLHALATWTEENRTAVLTHSPG